jgi:hypothetical protein
VCYQFMPAYYLAYFVFGQFTHGKQGVL